MRVRNKETATFYYSRLSENKENVHKILNDFQEPDARQCSV